MTIGAILGIIAAGIGAGAINTMVGSGSLVSFPILLAFGYSPLVANITNTIGLVPGSISGAWGYRRELEGQKKRIIGYGVVSLLGAIGGAALLLILPESAFKAIVPIIIGLAVLLVLVQPWLNRVLERRREQRPVAQSKNVVLPTGVAVFFASVYGGYFSAAQGILLLAILGLGLPESLQRVNGLKNVLQTLVNIVAAIVFVVAFPVSWDAVGLMAIGTIIGGQLGAVVGRRLPAWVLRALIVVVGIVAIFMLR
ncbi:sulfite exporter TauE/SafE family protein [Gleimia hominis]|uniref:sulfite exporter TauE/SafE family protein n=1 Tax=Gleimia hominis TaxID=595468 RepID=UPI000C7FDBAA|nr:sulfite exporter TauE/SafE family protein [Gleimia hominis]WIK64702.1 sulfite exporter TauE/SafE family protein [Gleimia hominis]